MSNMIQVEKGFVPFRWNGDKLEALIKNEWKEVFYTGKKNSNGDKIFTSSKEK
jgi:hypothetical protein